MKPLVLFVHGSAEMYGSDKVLLNLVTALDQGGALVPVVLLHEQGPLHAALVAAGVEVHVASVMKISRALFGLQAPSWLLRSLRQTLADFDLAASGREVALVYSNTLAVLGGAVWAGRRKVPHIWHVHEIIQRPALVRRALPWLAHRLSVRVVSNSRPTQAWLLDQAPQLADRAEVIFNGLPAIPPADAAAVAAFRASLGLDAGRILVTVAGRLNHWKGQNLLIDAVALLAREGRAANLHLAIVGDAFAGHDDWRSRLQAQVERLGLQAQVSFVPFIADIYSAWRASDIAVVPSLEPEPFGMVAIEAMGCALPVVAAAHGGLLDIVQHGETGRLFPPGDARSLAEAIADLAGDPGERRRMGLAGALRQAELFSLDSQAAATQRLCLQWVGT